MRGSPVFKILRSTFAVAVLAVPLAAFAQGDGFGMPARNGVQLPVVKNMPPVSFSWKGDSKTSVFHNRGAGLTTGSTTKGETEGLRELAHLGFDAKAGDASLHAGAILQGYTFVGNNHGQQVNQSTYPDQTSGYPSNAIRLDYAYLETPIGGGVDMSVGRQIVNWGYCFTACDTRRDRIKFIKVIHNWVLVDLWDKRASGVMSQSNAAAPLGDYRSGYMWLNGVVAGFHPGMNSSLHFGTFISIFRGDSATGANAGAPNSTISSGYALEGVDLWSSWIRGNIGGWQYLGNLNVTKNGKILWPDTSEAYAVRVSHDLMSNQWNLAGQYIGVHNGGLISSGYDTFSSLVNNSPAMDTSPTNVTNLGGTGVPGVSQFKQWMAMVRLSWMPTPAWTLNLAAGRMHRDGGTGAGGANAIGNLANFAPGTTENDNVFDLQAHYQLSSNVRTWATWGMIDPSNSNAPMYNGTGYSGSIQAVSLNIQAVF